MDNVLIDAIMNEPLLLGWNKCTLKDILDEEGKTRIDRPTSEWIMVPCC
jgi:hypothetical protein